MILFNEYPNVIAQLEVKLAKAGFNIDQLESSIKDIEAEIDEAIAFNAEYKNDAQRKAAKKAKLNEHPQYWEMVEDLRDAKLDRELEYIELCRIRAEFSVLKLDRRERIALLELQTAAAK